LRVRMTASNGANTNSGTSLAMLRGNRAGTYLTSLVWTGRCGSPHSKTHGAFFGFHGSSRGSGKMSLQ
jgi:hypothetical protein